MAVTRRGGREAVTHFRVLESWGGHGHRPGRPSAGKGSGGYSLLEVKLETGRTHQIRVHLAAIGHPVAGDNVYGTPQDELGVGRQFLHSTRLRFTHPETGETVDVSSPLPPDLEAVLEQLRSR